ncbi:MAG: hypothetical protein D6714_04210, partial [Bacteroidetes bacterium]
MFLTNHKDKILTVSPNFPPQTARAPRAVGSVFYSTETRAGKSRGKTKPVVGAQSQPNDSFLPKKQNIHMLAGPPVHRWATIGGDAMIFFGGKMVPSSRRGGGLAGVRGLVFRALVSFERK